MNPHTMGKNSISWVLPLPQLLGVFGEPRAHLDPYPVEVEPSVPRIDWVSRVSSTQSQQTTKGGGRMQFIT